jgi:DNA polymerase-3 subunit gamma/tau
MPTLYRKYRPQTFAEVAGQEPIKMTLSFEITANRLAHAYLFCGPRAIGKTTMARLLAKSVNCQKRKKDSADPCNECPSCLEITQGNSLDISEIDAASHTGVDNVRDSIIAAARIAPSRSTYKVFIIDEAHMLSTAAFNALLKIMEEPPAHVMFILCTTEAHKLPLTIISRCQRFDFKKIGYAEIVKKLTRIATNEDINIEPAVIEAVARHSGGHMRDAESLFGQIISLGGEGNSLKGTMITLAEAELVIPRSLLKEAITFLEFLMIKDASGAVGYINQLVDDGVDLKIFAQDVVEMARQSMLAKINPTSGIKTGLEFGDSIESRLTDITTKFDLTDISAIIERFSVAGREIKDAPISQLPLELAVVDICFGSTGELKQYSAPVSPRSNVKSAVSAGAVENVGKASSAADASDSQKSMFTQAALNDIWQELLIRIRQHNHSLAFVIKSCNPTAGENNSIRLAFKYKIHHDRLNDPAIKGLVEGLLKDISGQSVSIISVLDPEAIIIDTIKSDVLDVEPSKIATAAVQAAGIDASAIDNLLKTFGGKVVG